MFSRNLESQNQKYEGLLNKIKSYLKENKIKRCILDGEIVVFDKTKNEIRSFQDLQNNKIKANAEE